MISVNSTKENQAKAAGPMSSFQHLVENGKKPWELTCVWKQEFTVSTAGINPKGIIRTKGPGNFQNLGGCH